MHLRNSLVAITHRTTLGTVSAVLHVSWPIYKFYCYILLRLLHNLYSRMEWPGNLPVHKQVCLVTERSLAVSWRWGHKIFPLTQRSHTQCDKQDNCWICLLSEKKQANLSVPRTPTAVKECIDHLTTMKFGTVFKLQKSICYRTQCTILPILCVPFNKLNQSESMDRCTRWRAGFLLFTYTDLPQVPSYRDCLL